MMKNFLSFKKAREIARSLKIRSKRDWDKNKNMLPKNIPRAPTDCYKNTGWISWYDWLGTERITFLPFKEACEIARSLKIRSLSEWNNNNNILPKNIPTYPYHYYKNTGWISWYDWLGTERKKK